MIQHIWSLVCKESKIEAETNNISVIDLYESLQFDLKVDEATYDKTKPVVGPFNFEIVSLFYRDEKGTHAEFDILAKIVDPKGAILGEFTNKSEFKEEHNRVRNRMRFNTIALTTSGVYIVQVFLKRKEEQEQVAAIPLDIKVKLNNKEL